MREVFMVKDSMDNIFSWVKSRLLQNRPVYLAELVCKSLTASEE